MRLKPRTFLDAEIPPPAELRPEAGDVNSITALQGSGEGSIKQMDPDLK